MKTKSKMQGKKKEKRHVTNGTELMGMKILIEALEDQVEEISQNRAKRKRC